MKQHAPAIAALLALLPGCATPAARPDAGQVSATPSARQLLVLHASDLESELLGSGEPAPDSGGIGRFVGVVRALRARSEIPTITVAAGDTFMPAPALQVELAGENAVGLANDLVGFDASALGNHEFDRGAAFLADRIRSAAFPYLTATVQFHGGPLDEVEVAEETFPARTPWLADHPGRVLPRGLLCAGGELRATGDGPRRCSGTTVGVIGATTETLRTISSTLVDVGLPPDFTALRGLVQAQADALAAEGVDIVILLSHLQDVRREVELVESGLTGVDLIVSGGGDDRLANASDRLLAGDERHALCAGEQRCYPLLREAADGKPVAVVATDGQLRYVGHLALTFDARGVISGVGESSRPWPVDDSSLALLEAQAAPDALVLEAQVRSALHHSACVLAESAHFLDGEREAVRNGETNLGNLAADSLLHAARAALPDAKVRFGLRNAGGIRASIGHVDPSSGATSGGRITLLDIREALRFDNELVVVETTRRALVETFESALRGAGTGRGHFPQVSAGVELVYDPLAPEQIHRVEAGEVTGIEQAGSRVRRLVIAGEILVDDGRSIDPDARIAFVTLAYLARGGDGWFPGSAAALDVVPLGLHEQQVLADFLRERVAEGTWNDGAAWAAADGRVAKSQ